MFKQKSVWLFVSMALISIFLVACGNSDASGGDGNKNTSEETLTLKFAHEENDGDVQDLYAKKFKEIIEEKSKGRIKVDIYTAGTLGTNMDVLQSLQTGAIELAITSPGFSGDIIPESQIMAIPFLFSENLEVNRKVLNESEALYGLLAEKYEEKGIKPFKFWLEGFMWWTANRQLTTLDEMKGFKMRTMPTNLIIKSYELMGANPTPTDSGEIYTMLQTGGIDGQENPLFYIYNSHFHEVQDYLIESNHHIYTTVTAANLDFFNTLTVEDQQLIEEVIKEVNDWSFEMQEEEAQKALVEIENFDIEIIRLTNEQREAFKEFSLPVREQFVNDVGEDAQLILETIEADIKRAEEELGN